MRRYDEAEIPGFHRGCRAIPHEELLRDNAVADGGAAPRTRHGSDVHVVVLTTFTAYPCRASSHRSRVRIVA